MRRKSLELTLREFISVPVVLSDVMIIVVVLHHILMILVLVHQKSYYLAFIILYQVLIMVMRVWQSPPKDISFSLLVSLDRHLMTRVISGWYWNIRNVVERTVLSISNLLSWVSSGICFYDFVRNGHVFASAQVEVFDFNLKLLFYMCDLLRVNHASERR